MTIAEVAIERMDTWIFRVSIAVPVVCLVLLALWHLISLVARKLPPRGKPVRRQSPEPDKSFPSLKPLPSDSIRAGPPPGALPAGSGDAQAERTRRAKELLALTREDFRNQHFLSCLERCQTLAATFPDLPEGAEARELAAQIKNDPARLEQVCAALAESLAQMYLELAESWLGRGQLQQASVAWHKVLQCCPETRPAQLARDRLRQLDTARPTNTGHLDSGVD
jgi:hypothetical protein